MHAARPRFTSSFISSSRNFPTSSNIASNDSHLLKENLDSPLGPCAFLVRKGFPHSLNRRPKSIRCWLCQRRAAIHCTVFCKQEWLCQ